MTPPARLLVIQNDPTCPPGLFGETITAQGVALEVRRGYDGDPIPADLSEHAGLMILGGEMAATDDATYPWLTAAKSLIRAAIGTAPILGICLGHQLIAEALGGAVRPNPHGRALGLTPVARTDEGRADPLLGALDGSARAVAWNSDVVVAMPAGARLLATNPDGTPQAVRFAASAWGVQFHPEITAEIFRSWQVDGDVQAEAEAAAIGAAEVELMRTWSPVAKFFARRCLSGARR